MERLKPEREKDGYYASTDLIQLHRGLGGQGILLEDLKKYALYWITPGMSLREYITFLAESDRVRIEYTAEDGPVLKYINVQEIEKLEMARQKSGREAREVLAKNWIIPQP